MRMTSVVLSVKVPRVFVNTYDVVLPVLAAVGVPEMRPV